MKGREMSREARAELYAALEFDEYGQGYNEKGMIVCICGEVNEDADWSNHYCVADNDPDES